MSFGVVIAVSLLCGVVVAATANDRGRGLRETFRWLNRVDKLVVEALVRLWRSS